MYILVRVLFRCSLSQDVEYSSLYYAVRPCHFSCLFWNTHLDTHLTVSVAVIFGFLESAAIPGCLQGSRSPPFPLLLGNLSITSYCFVFPGSEDRVRDVLCGGSSLSSRQSHFSF